MAVSKKIMPIMGYMEQLAKAIWAIRHQMALKIQPMQPKIGKAPICSHFYFGYILYTA